MRIATIPHASETHISTYVGIPAIELVPAVIESQPEYTTFKITRNANVAIAETIPESLIKKTPTASATNAANRPEVNDERKTGYV